MSLFNELEDWLRPFYVDDSTLQSLTLQLSSTYSHLALHSKDQFLATPITLLPDGSEQGLYLAIDFGGSNLRVGFIELFGGRSDIPGKSPANGHGIGPFPENFRKINEHKWAIGEHLKVDKAEDLFDWVGACIANVVTTYEGGSLPSEIPLAITFSFPMIQTSLSQATVMPMGKGFLLTANPDLGELLLAGYSKHRHDIPDGLGNGLKSVPSLKIAAITNDAVATMVSLKYSMKSRPGTRVVAGLIMGTGCNAATSMRLEALGSSKIPPHRTDNHCGSIVVNTEWTINGTAGPLRELGLMTRWDDVLSRSVFRPGFQPFEYMTAGHYLGEIVRLILAEFFSTRISIPNGDLPHSLSRPFALSTEYLSRVVTVTPDPTKLAAILNSDPAWAFSNNWTWTEDLARLFKMAERAISRRSAALIAAANIALLNSTGDLELKGTGLHDDGVATYKSSKEALAIAYIGGLIVQHGGYKDEIQRQMDSLVAALASPDSYKQVILQEAPDGGLVGAAALASTVWPLK